MMTGLLLEVVSAADSVLNNVSPHHCVYEKTRKSGSALCFCDSSVAKTMGLVIACKSQDNSNKRPVA